MTLMRDSVVILIGVTLEPAQKDFKSSQVKSSLFRQGSPISRRLVSQYEKGIFQQSLLISRINMVTVGLYDSL